MKHSATLRHWLCIIQHWVVVRKLAEFCVSNSLTIIEVMKLMLSIGAWHFLHDSRMTSHDSVVIKRQEINEQMKHSIENGWDHLETVSIHHDLVIALLAHKFEMEQSSNIFLSHDRCLQPSLATFGYVDDAWLFTYCEHIQVLSSFYFIVTLQVLFRYEWLFLNMWWSIKRASNTSFGWPSLHYVILPRPRKVVTEVVVIFWLLVFRNFPWKNFTTDILVPVLSTSRNISSLTFHKISLWPLLY